MEDNDVTNKTNFSRAHIVNVDSGDTDNGLGEYNYIHLLTTLAVQKLKFVGFNVKPQMIARQF